MITIELELKVGWSRAQSNESARRFLALKTCGQTRSGYLRFLPSNSLTPHLLRFKPCL